MSENHKGNVINLSDYYKDVCGGQKTVEVSDEVLECLKACKREENKLAMRDYRHLAPFGLDEVQTGEIFGAFEESAEDTYFTNVQSDELYAAMRTLKPEVARRFYLHHAVGMTMRAIAEQEGVSPTAVSKSIKRAAEKLRELLTDNN